MKSLYVASALLFAIMFFSCSNNLVTSPDKSDPGSADITFKVGKVGALGKTAIELTSLYVTLSAPGETTIRDTFPLSGNSQQTIAKTYSNLASLLKTWTLEAESRDDEGVVIHSGSASFIVPARRDTSITLDLSAQYSMLKANFLPIRDSVTRCELLVDEILVEDSSFAKQSLVGDTVKLSYCYLRTNILQRVKLDVYGEMWGFDTLLYTGDTAITPVPGVNASYNVTLRWVGPALPPPGSATMNVVLGAVGTTTINGQLLKEPTLLATLSAPSCGVIALNPITNRLYTAVSESDVGVLDLNTNTFIASIPTSGYFNIWMVVNPVTNRFYVSQEFAGTVRVVDASNNSTIANVSVPGLIHTVGAVGVNVKTNKIYICRNNNGDIIIMDGVTHEFGAAVNVGGAIGSSANMAIDTATDKVYCCVPGNRLAVFDGSAITFETFITVGTSPCGLAVNPVTRNLYAANYNDNTVSVVDMDADAVTATIAVGAYPECICVNTQNNRIYVANSGGTTISVISGTSNSVLATYTVPVQPGFIAINQNTNRLYISGQSTLLVYQE
jgi:YVTN family beta-propeller protein